MYIYAFLIEVITTLLEINLSIGYKFYLCILPSCALLVEGHICMDQLLG